MRYGSVCSGIEAASVAWHSLGWEAAWLAEIEPFPSAVLKHHYPSVPNYGDMTALADRVSKREIEAPDMLVGGTPCQAFSVAGLRQSLDDNRGQLTIKFLELADAIDTVRRNRGEPECIIVWENVPGVLSTKDNALGCFLAGLAGESEPLLPAGGKWSNAGCVFGPTRTVAWRVLDAQYFGVAQRRRRVFVIASARDDFNPAAVLFEFDGLRRDIAPSREAREEVAGVAAIGPSCGRLTDLNPTLDTRAKDGPTVPEKNRFPAVQQPMGMQAAVAFVQNTRDEVRLMGGDGGIVGALAAQTGAKQQCYVAQAAVAFSQNQLGEVRAGSVFNTINTNSNASGRNTPMVAYPLDLRNAMRDPEKHDEQNREGCGLGDDGDPAHTLTRAHVHGVVTSAVNETVGTLCAEAGPNTHGCRGVSGSQTMLSGYIQPTVNMYGADMYNGAITGDVAATLGARSGDGLSSGPSCIGNFACNQGVDAWPNMQVRRLTPTECERLQGFPDGYTLVPHRGKPAADGPRYKSLGNSMAVPVMAWIGKRIDQAIQ